METWEYSVKLAPYVYTKKAEAQARKIGAGSKQAGTIAMLGGEPINDDYRKPGTVAYGWFTRGYIMRREEYVD